MRVKLKVGLAGKGYAHSPGDEIEVSNLEGGRLIKAEFAESVIGGAASKKSHQQKKKTKPAARQNEFEKAVSAPSNETAVKS